MYIKNISDFIFTFLKDKSRKNLIRIIGELIYLSFYYKTPAFFYFSRYLFKKGVTNIKDYMPNKLFYKFAAAFNDPSLLEVMNNKLVFDRFFRKHHLPLPQLLMYNKKDQFFIGNNQVSVNNLPEFTDILKSLLNKTGSKSVFIKKMEDSYGGKNIYKVSQRDFDEKKDISVLFSLVINSAFIFQETIIQHPGLFCLNPSCVNTIRMDTFIDKDGNIEIISAFLRTTGKNAYVDNISSGGLFIGIELTTGKLKKFAYSSLLLNGGKIATEHPFSHFSFENFPVPFFDEAKKVVLLAASLVPTLRLIGWDVAIGEDGPLLIEGNSRYAIQASELAYGGYKRNPVFKKAMNELPLLKQD